MTTTWIFNRLLCSLVSKLLSMAIYYPKLSYRESINLPTNADLVVIILSNHNDLRTMCQQQYRHVAIWDIFNCQIKSISILILIYF